MIGCVKYVLAVGGLVEAGFEGLDGLFEGVGLEDFVGKGGELEIKVVRDLTGFEARWFRECGPDVLEVFFEGFGEVGEGCCAEVVT
jgi:hypothetical protein